MLLLKLFYMPAVLFLSLNLFPLSALHHMLIVILDKMLL